MTLSTSMNRDVEGLELKEKNTDFHFGSQTGVKNLLYGSYADKFLQAICGEAGFPVAFHCNPVVAMRRGEEKSRMRGKPTSILLKYA